MESYREVEWRKFTASVDRLKKFVDMYREGSPVSRVVIAREVKILLVQAEQCFQCDDISILGMVGASISELSKIAGGCPSCEGEPNKVLPGNELCAACIAADTIGEAKGK